MAKLTEEEARAHFPGAVLAVLAVEETDAGDEIFAIHRTAGHPPGRVIRSIKGGLESAYRHALKIGMDVDVAREEEAIRQMDHPDFLKYVKGKLGAV